MATIKKLVLEYGKDKQLELTEDEFFELKELMLRMDITVQTTTDPKMEFIVPRPGSPFSFYGE